MAAAVRTTVIGLDAAEGAEEEEAQAWVEVEVAASAEVEVAASAEAAANPYRHVMVQTALSMTALGKSRRINLAVKNTANPRRPC